MKIDALRISSYAYAFTRRVFTETWVPWPKIDAPRLAAYLQQGQVPACPQAVQLMPHLTIVTSFLEFYFYIPFNARKPLRLRSLKGI